MAKMRRHRDVRGLTLLAGAVPQETAEALLRALEGEEWARWRYWRPFSRQDFGFEYDISSRGLNPATPIPAAMRDLFPALRTAGWTGADPEQVIVTRYPPGGKLSRHIDAPVFGGVIAGLSLGAVWPIVFEPPRWGAGAGAGVQHLPLPERSAYVMSGEARTRWFHQVPPTVDAGTRVSLTFRTLAKK